ncbi:hypothetical protein EJB05_11663, partial [Eragrostis curvula]
MGLIAERVHSNSIADYIRFRAVCTAWRSCSDDPRALGVFDRGWIMLPRAFDIHDRRCFLNIFTGWCIHLRIPLLHRRYVLGQTTDGLLVLCWKVTHVVHLLNPVTGKLINLPPATAKMLPWITRIEDFLRRYICAALVDDSVAVLQLGRLGLVIAKPSDKDWTRLYPDGAIMSTMSFAGRIYCATTKKIMVVETAADKQQPQLVTAANYECGEASGFFTRLCLVDNDGVLILVRVAYGIQRVKGQLQRTCKVYRVDLEARMTVTMAGVGGRTVFVNDRGDRALSVPAGVSPSICADTVYLCSRYNEGTGRAQVDAFHLPDGRIDMDCRNERPCSMVDHIACYVAERQRCCLARYETESDPFGASARGCATFRTERD